MTDRKRSERKPDAKKPRLKRPEDAVKDLAPPPKGSDDVRGGGSCAQGEHIKKATL